MPEYRAEFSFNDTREHIAKVNIPNIVCRNHDIDTDISHGLRNHVTVPDTVKNAFNIDIESTQNTRSNTNNVGRALVKKKVVMLSLKKNDRINNSRIYDIYKDY